MIEYCKWRGRKSARKQINSWSFAAFGRGLVEEGAPTLPVLPGGSSLRRDRLKRPVSTKLSENSSSLGPYWGEQSFSGLGAMLPAQALPALPPALRILSDKVVDARRDDLLLLAFIGCVIPRKQGLPTYVRTFVPSPRAGKRRGTNRKQFAETFAQVTRHKWRSDDGARNGRRNFGPGHWFSRVHDV